MGEIAFIVWRESVEALLVVGILYAWLRTEPAGRRGLPWLWAGVGCGLLLAGALALALLRLACALHNGMATFAEAAVADRSAAP